VEFFIMCSVGFGHFFHGDSMWTWEDRLADHGMARVEVCLEIAETADEMGVDPSLAVAVGWVESKFYGKAKSKIGALGPLQVLPQYHCPNKTAKGCELIRAGVGALNKYVRKYKNTKKVHNGVKDALCHYSSGNKCTKQGRRYAAKVYRVKWRIDAALALWDLHRQGLRLEDVME